MSPPAFRGEDRHSLNIEKLQAGDPEHFQKLYKVYYRLFLSEACQLLIQKEKAAAIVNHSFIKCWLRSDAISSDLYVFAFLRTTITRNCYECNSSRTNNLEYQDLILQNILTDPGFSSKSGKELLAEITQLPEAQIIDMREIFSKIYRRQMTVIEIAEETGLQETGITASFQLACKMLHVILSEELS